MRNRINRVNRHSGVTLIELMIVVVIVSVLLLIALPAFQTQILKGKRAAAQAEMMEIANRQQQFLLDTRRYATKAEIEAIYDVDDSVEENYAWSIDLGATALPTFVVIFDSQGKQSRDGGNQNLTLTHDGQRTPSELWE